MVLRAFSMGVHSQAEDEGQHVHEKAAETWRDSPNPFTRFGSRDCWLLTCCSTRATYIKPFTASILSVHLSFYISLHLFYIFLLSDSRYISLGLATRVKVCSLIWYAIRSPFFRDLTFYAWIRNPIAKIQRSSMSSRIELVRLTVSTLLDFTASILQGKARLERSTKGVMTSPYLLSLLHISFVCHIASISARKKPWPLRLLTSRVPRTR